VDMKTYLTDDILVKVDRASMANSLEVRCPLLDHKLMELIAQIPSGLKLNNGQGKYIFKKSSGRKLSGEELVDFYAKLVDRGDKVQGHLMTYDLESREGTIYQAETTYERGLYHGERIRKVDENELDVKSGSYSTCSLDQPHYHFQARWMKIYLKDKMVAKPVVFYVRNVPLLALPFWIFPIKPGRHSGFIFPQFEIGLSTTAGQFIRNAGYYYAPNDYVDFTVAGDYYQAEPSWVIRSEANYKLLYAFDGQATYSFAHNDRDKSDNYDFNGYHQQEFSPRTRLQARGSWVSSRA